MGLCGSSHISQGDGLLGSGFLCLMCCVVVEYFRFLTVFELLFFAQVFADCGMMFSIVLCS